MKTHGRIPVEAPPPKGAIFRTTGNLLLRRGGAPDPLWRCATKV